IIHTTWNAIIQGPFARASTGYQTEIWIGESGLITCTCTCERSLNNGIPSGMDDNRRPNTTCDKS
ncbi:hypothetical protein ACT453_16530, partial [Bacillus sp. D-CC]